MKPTVHYDPAVSGKAHLGLPAFLYALDHPRLGAGPIRTSVVIDLCIETGRIETMNTVYLPQ